MRRIALLLLLCGPLIARGQIQSVHTIPAGPTPIFNLTDKLWKQTPDEFMAANQASGLRWESSAKDTARVAHPGLTFLGMPVVEAIARFDKGALKELTVSAFNRGDAGDLSEDEFEKLLIGVDAKLNTELGSKGTLLRTQERSPTATIHRKSWIKEPHRIDLVWGITEKNRNQGRTEPRPEFARIQVTAFEPTQDPRKTALATGSPSQPKTISALELKSRLKQQANGDYVITGVPMVDQGQKGYCAAAVAERILRYYGRAVDQHEIAQLANTSSDGGTRNDQMVAALRRIGDQTRMDVTVLQDFEMRDLDKTISDYNRVAKQKGSSGIGRSAESILVYKEMDVAILKEARAKRDGPMTEFKKKIAYYINNGAPLEWGCIVGKVAEKPEINGFGGHMRLIIGYNDRTGEILYTDTWGPGHELKRMSTADAWTVTLGLYCFQPRDLHF